MQVDDNGPTGGSSNVSTLLDRCRREDALDGEFGFVRINDSPVDQNRLGWLYNAHPTLLEDKETHIVHSCVDFYFLEQDGSTFKATLQHYPYFYLGIRPNRTREVESFLQRKFETLIHSIEPIQRVDLEMKNHLAGLTATYLRISFLTVQDLVACRMQLAPVVAANKARRATSDVFEAFERDIEEEFIEAKDHGEYIDDIREYDIPYYQRVLIDTNIRVSKWYNVKVKGGKVEMTCNEEIQQRAQAKILAFDIECTKAPLKFPDTQLDSVMMISYMIDGQGYLIINREHVGADIEDFEYTPKPEMKGPFVVWNEKDEVATLQRFVDHIKEEKPNIFVTFNGDGFDWRFLEERARILRMPMAKSLGLSFNKQDEYYSTRHACHLDAFHWVRRDSYLPQGSQGLKAVTRSKLGYDPLEIDPELMVQYALEKPIEMAQYSVSDAVATYYLYMKYVHPFIFSLCNILPMHPDDTLRKGTGTLCEALLMVEAHKVDVIFPNKKGNEFGKFYDGHLIEAETYVGGHVEALSAGIYRADLDCDFTIDSGVIKELLSEVDRTIKFFVEVECKASVDDLVNYEEIRAQIIAELSKLPVDQKYYEKPKIYHVDVAAMYPNIILTYRLQPTSIVNDTVCSGCIFNQPESKCKKKLDWQWRVDYLPARKAEYEQVKSQLELEVFAIKQPDGTEKQVSYLAMSPSEQQEKLLQRLKQYCRQVYKKTHETETIKKKDTVCMRENPLYVDTVRDFRDRRYIYRTQAKDWGRRLDEAKEANSAEKILEATDMVVLYDSLQLAHKCILNSFYGYVMRKGARWYSMEMAAIVTHTGSEIIKRSRQLIERIGKPLELDTDGIWCCVPNSFPDCYDLVLKTKDGKTRKSRFNFLCSTLNARIHSEFSNPQYQTLENPKTLEYSMRTECSIFFELDGPYKCMVLPTSTEEGKQLKKRYAVFGFDGKLHEFKGFELKRRGELKAVKDFQSQIFDTFLEGKTLTEAYDAAARVANYFLDILDSRGEQLRDEELLEMLSESRSMSKGLDEYEKQKSTSITCAKRLTEFLGSDSKSEKGLACRFIISAKPEGRPVAERAIPVQIFSAAPAVQVRYIRKWCNDNSLLDVSMRAILDWAYYRTRLSAQFQKLITLPAYFQGVQNPVKRVAHPDWLQRRMRQHEDGKKQLKISDMFKAAKQKTGIEDLEEIALSTPQPASQVLESSHSRDAMNHDHGQDEPDDDDEEEDVLAPMDIEEMAVQIRSARAASARAKPLGSTRQSVQTQDFVSSAPSASAMDIDTPQDAAYPIESEGSDDEEDDAASKGPKPSIFGLMMKKGGVDSYLNDQAKSKSKSKKRQQQDALARLAELERGATAPNGSGSSAPDNRKRARHAVPSEVEDLKIQALGESPDETEDYQGWLQYHKQLWRLQLARRKRRKQELGANAALLSSGGNRGGGGNLGGFLNRANLSLLQKTWNILQIAESDHPGILKLWVVTDDNSMHKVDLKVDRRVFINSFERLEEHKHHEVQSSLPRMRTRHHLYAWEIGEQEYRDRQREIEAQKTDPGVEGFYESQVPLTFRAIMELGCMCKVKRDAKSHDMQTPWELSELESLVPPMATADKPLNRPTYLSEPRPKYVYLYQVGTSTRSLFGLYNPNRRKCVLIYVATHPQDDISPLLRQLPNVSEMNMAFELNHEYSLERALAAVNAALGEIQRELSGPMVVITQCSLSQRDLLAGVGIFRQIPMMKIAANKKEDEFPALGWLKRGCGIFVQRALQIERWYTTSIELARYTQVPIGNFEPDFAVFLSDVFFARRLKQNDCVLWYSEKLQPDLGGNEDDDNAFNSELVNPDKTYPDCVETISIEFDLKGLAVNTILQSNHIPDLENSLLAMESAASKLPDTSSKGVDAMNVDVPLNPTDSDSVLLLGMHAQSFDETTSSVRAFKILKHLVTGWSIDTMTHKLPPDLLVSNFYRWISSPHSKMYDPALHRLVHKLIKKVYIQLLAEFKKLGARIIHSSFNKLVVATERRTLVEAQAYASFLQKTFKRNRELFRYIDISPISFYDVLLFKDPHNFVGIPAAMPYDDEEPNAPIQASTRASSSQTIEANESASTLGIGQSDSFGLGLDSVASDTQPLNEPTTLEIMEEMARFDAKGDDLMETQPIGKSSKRSRNNEIPSPIASLHISDYLPAAIRRHLSVVIYGFAIELLKNKRETMRRMKDQPGLLIAADAKKAGLAHAGGSLLLDDASNAKDTVDIMTDYYRELKSQTEMPSSSSSSSGGNMLSESTQQEILMEEAQDKAVVKVVTERLFNICKDVERIVVENHWTKDGGINGPEAADLKLLVHPEFRYENPALEFVKVACYMISLKKSIADNINAIRRNLLKSLQVREFSAQAAFKDPVISYSLPNVVCGYCNSCRDLDLLRDPRLAQRKWDCPTCSHTYDREAVEERLVDIVHRRMSAFQTQDICCDKCGDVQSANLNAICTACSGALSTKDSPAQFRTKMLVFTNIAKFHAFHWLEDTVNFALQLIPQ